MFRALQVISYRGLRFSRLGKLADLRLRGTQCGALGIPEALTLGGAESRHALHALQSNP